MNMGKKLYKHDKYITLSQSGMKLNLNYVWLMYNHPNMMISVPLIYVPRYLVGQIIQLTIGNAIYLYCI